jgi:hypothetical protein
VNTGMEEELGGEELDNGVGQEVFHVCGSGGAAGGPPGAEQEQEGAESAVIDSTVIEASQSEGGLLDSPEVGEVCFAFDVSTAQWQQVKILAVSREVVGWLQFGETVYNVEWLEVEDYRSLGYIMGSKYGSLKRNFIRRSQITVMPWEYPSV